MHRKLIVVAGGRAAGADREKPSIHIQRPLEPDVYGSRIRRTIRIGTCKPPFGAAQKVVAGDSCPEVSIIGEIDIARRKWRKVRHLIAAGHAWLWPVNLRKRHGYRSSRAGRRAGAGGRAVRTKLQRAVPSPGNRLNLDSAEGTAGSDTRTVVHSRVGAGKQLCVRLHGSGKPEEIRVAGHIGVSRPRVPTLHEGRQVTQGRPRRTRRRSSADEREITPHNLVVT